MGRDALESDKIMLTIPHVWTCEIDRLVAAGYGKNRQAIICLWLQEHIAALLSSEKKETKQ